MDSLSQDIPFNSHPNHQQNLFQDNFQASPVELFSNQADQAVPDYQNRLTEGEEEEEQGVTSQPTTDFLEYDFLGDGHLQDYPGLNTNQICFC